MIQLTMLSFGLLMCICLLPNVIWLSIYMEEKKLRKYYLKLYEKGADRHWDTQKKLCDRDIELLKAKMEVIDLREKISKENNE